MVDVILNKKNYKDIETLKDTETTPWLLMASIIKVSKINNQLKKLYLKPVKNYHQEMKNYKNLVEPKLKLILIHRAQT